MAIRDSQLPYGHLPAIWSKSVVIEQLEGTRWYIEESHPINFRTWLEEIHSVNPGDLIPMQWAPAVVGVSRQALHKRAAAGNLTVFSFIPTERRSTILGRSKPRESRSSFDYVVLSECLAWRDEVLDRMDQDRQDRYAEEMYEANQERLPKVLRRKKRGRK
ncbi:MAG: hypothetical protein ACTS3F_06870 [Phycisphaerales bacterium]